MSGFWANTSFPMNGGTASPPQDQPPLRALIVDDDPTAIWAMGIVLEAECFKVASAANGKMGVAEFEQAVSGGDPFAIVFMDVQMPVMDGFAATKALRQQGAAVPIIAFTSLQQLEKIEWALASGFDAHLAKPPAAESVQLLLTRLIDTGRLPAIKKSSRVRSSRENDVSLAPLLGKYMERLVTSCNDVEAALFSDNTAAIAAIAHKFRGTAATYGFPELGEAARVCEETIRNKSDPTTVRSAIVDFLQALRTAGCANSRLGQK